MTVLMLLAILAPVVAGAVVAAFGWCRVTAVGSVLASAVILGCGIAIATQVRAGPVFAVHDLLRADALSATMLLVIGTVGSLACWASIGYLDTELAEGHTTANGARLYGVLVSVFLSAMTLAVQANNLGVLWVAIEATTIATAFLVGHRRSRAALEATWKYVIICSTGIAIAFLGTVLLYYAGRHAGGGDTSLNLEVLAAHASRLDPAVTRLAAGLLLLGYGAKAGLAPFHTWLADAHSQAPAPVSALMSGVLLAVAFSAILRVKAVIDVALGTGFMRAGLLITGLLTIAIATGLLVAQRDLKRMLAYSSMENMGLIAIAAAAGTTLAITALLLHVVAHGIAKTVLFITAGQLQAAHHSTTISDITAVLARSRLLAAAFTVGMIALLGLPPFALFASEVSMARGLTDSHLAWALAPALLVTLIAFVALMRSASAILLGDPPAGASPIAVSVTVSTALVIGIGATIALGVTAGPLTDLLHTAAALLGGRP